MLFKDIIVIVDSSRHCKARLKAATSLTRRFAAHVTGLYVMPPLEMSPFLADQFPPELIDQMHARAAERRDDARALFDSIVKEGGLAAHWIEERGDASEIAMLHARYADLAILGQPDPAESSADAVRPERVLMGSGRPTLMIPYIGVADSFGENILVAWNGSPQAARAVNDALPLLARARRVLVLSIDPPDAGASAGLVGEADIGTHLDRHGITAELSRTVTDHITVGDTLLSRATDEGTDLIVMGVYGHSRLRELALGGVSRHLLDHMTVPLFMSH